MYILTMCTLRQRLRIDSYEGAKQSSRLHPLAVEKLFLEPFLMNSYGSKKESWMLSHANRFLRLANAFAAKDWRGMHRGLRRRVEIIPGHTYLCAPHHQSPWKASIWLAVIVSLLYFIIDRNALLLFAQIEDGGTPSESNGGQTGDPQQHGGKGSTPLN